MRLCTFLGLKFLKDNADFIRKCEYHLAALCVQDRGTVGD